MSDPELSCAPSLPCRGSPPPSRSSCSPITAHAALSRLHAALLRSRDALSRPHDGRCSLAAPYCLVALPHGALLSSPQRTAAETAPNSVCSPVTRGKLPSLATRSPVNSTITACSGRRVLWANSQRLTSVCLFCGILTESAINLCSTCCVLRFLPVWGCSTRCSVEFGIISVSAVRSSVVSCLCVTNQGAHPCASQVLLHPLHSLVLSLCLLYSLADDITDHIPIPSGSAPPALQSGGLGQ